MDHLDNAEHNLNISLDCEDYLDIHAHSNPDENDIIEELFTTHFNKEQETEINGNDCFEEMLDSDVDLTLPKSPEREREKTPDVNEVKILIGKLKQDHIDYKEKYYEAQSQLAEYEVKLSEYMNSTMTLQVEVNALRETNQSVVEQNSTIIMKLDEKEAELKQFKGLVQKQVTAEEDTHALKKELAEKTKTLKKMEKVYATSGELLNKRIRQLLKYKRNFKKVMAQLLECSEILVSNNLLPLKQIKNLEHFMESFKDINIDSEDYSEDSSLSLEENAIHNHSAGNNTLTNGTYIKPNGNIISPNEELTKSCLSSLLSTSGSSANMESSTNIELSPLHQNLPHDLKDIHCEVSKNDKPHVFQLPFSPAKSRTQNSSNEGIQKNKITPNKAIEATVNSRFSGDVEMTDDFINLKEIMGSMVMKVEDLSLISPIPESPLKKFYSHSENIQSRKNYPHAQTPYKNSSIMPKDMSNECKKNRLSHQTSSGFDPHIEEKSESTNSSASNAALIAGNPFQTPITPNLHYLSSTFTNNTFQILHQGSSALDYIANSDTKFTAFVLTIPKKSPRNSIHNNKDDYVLPCVEERLSTIQSLYNAAIKPETSVKRGILNSRENKTDNSVNDPFPYICVQIDSKNGQINLTSNLQNNSVSDKHSNPCLTIEERKNEQINLSINQANNSVSNKHSDPCLSTEKQLSENMHEENLVPEYVEQENDDNQPVVSDSSDISPYKRKIAKTLPYHGINESQLNISKKENNFPIIDKTVRNYNESSETNQSSKGGENRSLIPNEMNKPKNSFSENHPQFSTFGDQNGLKNSFIETADKVLENSEKETKSILNTCNSNSRAVTSEPAIAVFDSDKTTLSSPECNIFVSKNKSEDEMHPAATCDNDLHNNSSPLKNEDNSILNTCELNNEAVLNETAISALESSGTSDKITTSTPKCISVDKNKSIDEMYFSVTYDNNLKSNLPHVKQKLFQDSDSKSHTLKPFKNKSYDTFDNSDKSKKEWKKTTKHSSLSFESEINSNPDKVISNIVAENKKKLQNVLSTDVELPASKKRKLVKSPLKLFSKYESIPTLSDKPPECVKTVAEGSPKIIQNFQSSVHLINPTTVDKSYGVFKNDEINFSSSCDEERNTTLNIINSVDSPKNIEEDTRPADLKSPNVNDLLNSMNTSNLSNASKKRKTKNKNKRKKKDLSSSVGICPKKSCHSEISRNLKTQSSDIKLLQKDFKNPSHSQLRQEEMKSDSNSPGLKKNDAAEFKTNTQINSGAEDSNKNTSNIPSLENTITKLKESIIHCESLNVQATVPSNKSSEEKKEPFALNIDQEKLTDKDNLSIKTISDNELKTIEKNGKADLGPADFKTNIQINSDAKINYENTCNIPSLENAISKTKEGVICESFNVQAVVHSRKSFEEKGEIIATISDNELKTIEKNGKSDFKTNIQINSDAKVNYENTCNIPSLENAISKTKEEVICESFNVQAVVHSRKSSEEKGGIIALNTDKDNLSIIKVSNNQREIVEENGKVNLSNNLPSGDLLNHKEHYSPSFSHATASESLKVGTKQELCLKEDDINIAAVNDTSSEERSKVSFSHTLENTENLEDSQNETHTIHRRNSCQSDISDDENPLVIADYDDCNSISETASNIGNDKAEVTAAAPENSTEENNEVASSSEIKKTVKNKRKKRKNSKTPNANKRKKSRSSCDESSKLLTIENVLNDIQKMKFEKILTNHSNYKQLQHSLINALINPANACDTISLLHQIFSFLSLSKLNPLVSYLVKKDLSVFFPPAENCIVEALIKIESRKKTHLQSLIPSAISALYYLILDKKTMSKTGLGALCRIFTQLCKHTQNTQKPISLTCDLIKEQHPHAPVLVAFIIGTWVELFEPITDTDVFRLILLSSIYFGLQKKPPTVTSADWNACKAIFKLTSLDPLPVNLEETTDVLISSVENLVTGPPSEKDKWACDQMLMFAVTKGWTWTQEKLLNSVIGSLHRYAMEVNNERAFSLYAELCADIGKQAPNDCVTILEVLSTLILEDYEFNYVRKYAAQSLLKLLLFKHLPLPPMLTECIQENENKLVELNLKRRLSSDSKTIEEKDILIFFF